MLAYPSRTDESWEGRNMCLRIDVLKNQKSKQALLPLAIFQIRS